MIEQAGGRVVASTLDREELAVADTVAGPVLIVDTGTTLMVPTGFTVRVLPGRHLLLERNAAQAVETAA